MSDDELHLQMGVPVDDFRARLVLRSSIVPSSSIRVQPTMAFSGVRNSCDRVARNSSFARLAASASRRAARFSLQQQLPFPFRLRPCRQVPNKARESAVDRRRARS